MDDICEVHNDKGHVMEVWSNKDKVAFSIDGYEYVSMEMTYSDALNLAHAIIAHFTKDQPK